MQSILDRHYKDDPDYDSLKASQKQARTSGVSSVLIGSGVTYTILKFTKIFKENPKYITLTSIGVGAFCGYMTSLYIMQQYKNGLKQQQHNLREEETNELVLDDGKFHSKYGDTNFFKDEKKNN